MSSERFHMSEDSSPSRRNVLRAAAIGGGLVWAAPVVQAVAGPAFAAGTPIPGAGLSYVAVLLRYRSVRYRIKFENDGGAVEVGSFTTPVCGTFPATAVPALGVSVPTVVQSHAFVGGSLQLVFTSGVTLLDWVAKQGQCCFSKAASGSTGYDVVQSGNTTTWPPAPNQPPCRVR